MIELTDSEKQLVSDGKLNPSDILKHREKFPVRTIDHNELDIVKQQIRDTNILYRESIDKNKELYEELVANRKHKEELRNKIAVLRVEKKKLLGLIQ